MESLLVAIAEWNKLMLQYDEIDERSQETDDTKAYLQATAHI